MSCRKKTGDVDGPPLLLLTMVIWLVLTLSLNIYAPRLCSGVRPVVVFWVLTLTTFNSDILRRQLLLHRVTTRKQCWFRGAGPLLARSSSQCKEALQTSDPVQALRTAGNACMHAWLLQFRDGPDRDAYMAAPPSSNDLFSLSLSFFSFSSEVAQGIS